MKTKGLGRGELHYNNKLNEKQVVEIYYSNLPRKELAKLYNISASNVDRIKNKETWKHLWRGWKKC